VRTPKQVVTKNIAIAGKHAARTAWREGLQKRTLHPVDRLATASPHADTPLPEEFHSLMYCDELSCAGAMEMIRVQLPSAMVARPAGLMQSGDAVYADVLVGADGIARGIRIVE